MWTLRRASIRLRSQGFNDLGASRASCVKLMPTSCVESEGAVPESHQMRYNSSKLLSTASTFYRTGHASQTFNVSRREISSQADVGSSKDDDADEMEDQLSELEADGDGTESETELLDGDEDGGKPHDELELSGDESDTTDKHTPKKRGQSQLFKVIVKAQGLSVGPALDKWAEKGNEISGKEFSLALAELRKRRMYGRAMQLFDWVESNKKLEFTEKDYASRLDFIAKLQGLAKAEKYIEHVPNSFRGELLYRTLLANCASQSHLKKTEEVFNKMKDLDLPISAFACNQLILIYKKVDNKKIADVLLLMEEKNVKPSPFTYKLLIDIKGRSNDIAGLEQIVETMKEEGIEADRQIQESLARHYASAGLKEKAEAILKEMEGENLKENFWVCPTLLRLYGILGKEDEVERIWKVCESNPRISDCMGAIDAWGSLKRIEKAVDVFEMMGKKYKLNSKNYAALLKIYAKHKMLGKGKDLIKQMGDNGCVIDPPTWDALVKLYVQSGEVEKADSVFQKATQQSRMKPMYSTYMTILGQYSKRGDVHNAEKIFYRMRQAGYTSRISPFQALVQTYINAKVPAYGLRERLKADNLFPNRSLAAQLALIDPFKKTPVSDLLD